MASPAHSHPLSVDDTQGRRPRKDLPPNNGNWDGSVRGYGNRKQQSRSLLPISPAPPSTATPASNLADLTGHKWHEYSDDEIEAKLGAGDGMSTIRALSLALQNMSQACLELEENHKSLQLKESSRRKRADELMRELQLPSERDVVKRVIQLIFTDDDERVHQVQRKQSHMVRPVLSLYFTLLGFDGDIP